MMTYVAATAVLWLVSGLLAVSAGVVLTIASASARRPVRLAGEGLITITRGVPTSLLVVAAGVTAGTVPAPGWLPDPFPGTQRGAALMAWSVTVALALGSTGHLAVLFRTAYLALGTYRIEQARVLGLTPAARFMLVAREAGPTVVAPTGARLVHHLHNTAFAALFPVADLFGWVQDEANATFQVSRYILIGASAYVAMSAIIWAGARTLEFALPGGHGKRPAQVPAGTPEPTAGPG
jgi:ABC-type amino acid transport system permease subunit